jgi:hypothetical protein
MKEQILKTLKAFLTNNEDVLSATEIEDVKKQIEHVENELKMERHTAYVKQLRDFNNHLSACFDILIGDCSDNNTMESFYNSKFEITFRGKKVYLINGAEVFQGIEEIIYNEIEEA